MLNNIFLTMNNKGARRNITLCLSSMLLALMVMPVAALAQSNDLVNRLNRLENDIDTLNRAVYKGEKPVNPVYTRPSGTVAADSNAQMEIRLQQMETQLRELTGRIEQQIYDISQMKNKQDDFERRLSVVADQKAQLQTPAPSTLRASQSNPLNLDLGAQKPQGMKTVIPNTVTPSTVTPSTVSVDATAQYEQAYAFVKSENYQAAQEGFEQFLIDNPDHALTANAKYWLGETHYVRGDYKKSARIFAEGFQAFPENAKSPDMLLKLGMSLAGMGKEKDACVALSQVAVKFPTGTGAVLERTSQEMDKLGCAG